MAVVSTFARTANVVAPTNRDVPLLMLHGDEDQMIAEHAARASFDALVAAGASRARFEVTPGLGHSVDTRTIRAMRSFVRECAKVE